MKPMSTTTALVLCASMALRDHAWSLQCTQTQDENLTLIDPLHQYLGDNFGKAIGYGDGLLVVGSKQLEVFSNLPGAISLFRDTGTGFSFLGEMSSSTPFWASEYASAIEVADGRILVGSPLMGQDRGTVYLYDQGPNGWVESRLDMSSFSGGEEFGRSLDVDGNTIVVGAPFYGGHGAAFVFEQTGSGWAEVQRIDGPGLEWDDSFGFKVSLDGDRLAISAPWQDPKGAVFLYERVAGVFVQTQEVASPSYPILPNGSEQAFGLALDLQGENLFVGFPTARAPQGQPQCPMGWNCRNGAVLVYAFDGSDWSFRQLIWPSATNVAQAFGGWLEAEGTTLLVGAIGDDTLGDDAGAAFVFEETPQGWIETARLLPSDGQDLAYFGLSVEIARDSFLVGAPNFSQGNELAVGKVYVFERVPRTQASCPGAPNSSGAAAEMAFDGCPRLGAGGFQLRASPVPDQPGLFYYGQTATSLPFGDGRRCIGGAVYRLPLEVGFGGTLLHDLDFQTPPSLAGAIQPGSSWIFQAWFRDPAAAGSGFNLSNALRVVFGS